MANRCEAQVTMHRGGWVWWFSLALGFWAPVALAYTELEFGAPVTISTQAGSADAADYVRLVRMSDGRLVAAWLDAVGTADSAWDLEGNFYPARDVFLSLSTDEGATWSDAVNVSNTALLTDPNERYDPVAGDAEPRPFYGDSDKASVFAVGNNLVVAWNDKYCGPGRHGPAVYADSGGVQVPFGCEYAARVIVGAAALTIVAVDRLTDGERDATAEMLRGTTAGFALAWQEDPLGLQPGEEEGEGEGASGARVTPGTDIWYSFMRNSAFQNAGAIWSAPSPVSNNTDYTGREILEGGASRVNFGLAGSASTVMLVYEEAKNAGPEDPGKNVVLHTFAFDAPDVGAAGTIVSAPGENARRARVFTQGTPGTLSGLRALVMWRQGEGIHGAPADVVGRVGRVPAGVSVGAVPTAGFRAIDLWPAIDPADPANNSAPLNLSASALDEPTGQNALEDAKAHRANLDGDFIYAAYTYAPDTTAPDTLFEFVVRRSFDGGATWDAPNAVSAATPHVTDAIEPRLMRTPSTVASGLPEDVRDPNVNLVAWGLEAGTADDGSTLQRSIRVTRTADGGETFERAQLLGSAEVGNEQVQLQVRPDGDAVYAVWRQFTAAGSEALFARAAEVERVADVAIAAGAGSATLDLGVATDLGFDVANAGPDVANDLVVDFTLPPEIAASAATIGGGVCSMAGPIRCTVTSLASGASTHLALTVAGNVAGAYALDAVVGALEVDPDLTDNAAHVDLNVRPVANLAATLTPSTTDPVRKRKTLTLTVAVRNAGPQPASGVQVATTLPATLTFQSGTGCNAAAALVTCSIAGVAAGAQSSVSFVVEAIAVGTATVSSTASAVEYDPVLADNSDAIEVTVKRAASGGGCAYAPGGDVDVVLPLILFGALLALRLRRRWRATG